MFTTLYQLIIRLITTRSRLIALGALGLVAGVVGLTIGLQDGDAADSWIRFVNSYGLSVLVPIVALLFGSAALGDMVDDDTLVYVWLRPISRRTLAAAAYLAALTVTLPVVVTPLGAGALLAGSGGSALAGSLLAAATGAVVYCALFCWLGLRIRHPLPWGLAYILIWEGFVAGAGQGASRLAVRAYTRAVLSHLSGVPLRLSNTSVPVALAVIVLVALAGVELTARRLRRADVA